MRLLVDAHVHLHACFDWPAFFDHAARNFRTAAAQLRWPGSTPGCLLLTESAGVRQFDALAESSDAARGRWALRRLDSEALRLTAADEPELYVLAGRQIVTAERLEVLALGTTRAFADGAAIDAVIEEVLQAGAVAVLPWGFGKWTGRRGRVIERLLESDVAPRLCFGDNGGRLRGTPAPRLFRLAAARQVPVLPGSDPLPFRAQVSKAGRYGFALEGSFSEASWSEHLKQRLRSMRAQPRTFGRREGWISFVRWQLAMQLRNRGRRSNA